VGCRFLSWLSVSSCLFDEDECGVSVFIMAICFLQSFVKAGSLAVTLVFILSRNVARLNVVVSIVRRLLLEYISEMVVMHLWYVVVIWWPCVGGMGYERIFGCLPKEGTPLSVKDCHLEMDTSPLLGLVHHCKFQMLLGMLQWLVTIGRPDLGPVVLSLNPYGACPCEYHSELSIRVFGYLKTCPDEQIAIDSRPMIFDRDEPIFSKLIPTSSRIILRHQRRWTLDSHHRLARSWRQ